MPNNETWRKDMAEKIAFVEGPLDDLLHALDPDVLAANYEVSGDRRETVRVIYPNAYVKQVNITGDSLKAIVEDVMAAL